jgi:glycosyltransferase involved in cell wall biosynthesis
VTPQIGLLWGDFPWDERGRRVGKLLSMGAVGRVTSRALGAAGRVLPYRPPASAAPEAHREALAAFLRASDVLVADVYESSAPALRLRHELGLRCPALLFAGGAMPKGAEAMLFPWRDLLRPGDALWFSSVADQRIWRRLVRRSVLREWVIPIGVDDALFRPHTTAERRAARLASGLPPDVPLLLAVGRLNVQKGLHLLLRLLAAVRRDVPRAHLCFTGETDDIGLHEFGVLNTGYVPWLRRQADALGLTGAVSFSGPRLGEDLAALTAAADVAVSASVYHRENGGLAPAEAQASGVPVVCTAWGGLKDVVQDGETGYLMDAVLTANGVRVDWAAGAAAVTALLRDPPARAAMGARAAARARQRYGLAAFADALAGAVGAALSPPGGEGGAPYEPSAFAARFEARKRAAGWYAAPAPAARAGRRPEALFAGSAYRLYERLMAPYATRLASALDARAVGPDWTPYFPSPVALDGLRSLAEDGDPIWPHRRFLRPAAWAVLRRVDGATTVAALTAAATAEHPTLDGPAVAALLRALYADGFVLFRRPLPPPKGGEDSSRLREAPAGERGR